MHRFDSGDPVRIVSGGYRGFSGVVSGYEAVTERLVITIEVFGRPTTISLDPEGVEKLA